MEEIRQGAIDDNTLLEEDEVDVISPNEDREMSFAIRSMLVERANKLAEALDRLRGGEYGLCVEWGEPIAPARLRAIPQVTTCVRCQDRLERTRPWSESVQDSAATSSRQNSGLPGGRCGGAAEAPSSEGWLRGNTHEPKREQYWTP